MILTVLSSDVTLVYGGRFAAGTVGAKSAFQSLSLGGQVEFNALGTDLSAQIFGGASETLTITIDGGTPTTINPPAAWTTTTIFSGLTDTVHSVKIKTDRTAGGFSLEVANAFALTGAAAAVSLPTNKSNNIYIVGSQTGITSDSSMVTLTSNGNASSFQGRDAHVRFLARANRISVWRFADGTKTRYVVDSTEQPASVSVPNTGTFDWYEELNGQDAAADHEYTFYGGSAAGETISRIMTVGGVLNTAAITALPVWAFYGDMVLKGTTGTGDDSTLGFAHRIGLINRLSAVNLGISNALVKGTTTPGGEAATRIASIPAGSNAVVVLYGFNDAAQLGGAETAASFGTSYANMLSLIRTQIGAGKPIYCLGILDTSNATPAANRTAFNAQIAAAVTAAADANIVYFNTDGWVVPAIDTTNGVDLNSGGHLKVANQILGAIAFLQSGVMMLSRGNPGLHGYNQRR